MGILERISKDNIFDVLDVIYTPTFENIQPDTPKWFAYVIKYWNDKEEIVGELETLGIPIPKWINTFQLPFEWDEPMLDTFFDTLSRHYVCNACIYSQNERFWYNQLQKYRFNQADILKKSTYSETPWQYVLRNPLLKKSKYIDKMADALRDSKRHSQYFINIDKYQELSKTAINTLTSAVIQHKKFKDVGLNFVGRNLHNISSAAVLRVYIDMVNFYTLSKIDIDTINSMPISCKIKLLSKLPIDKLSAKLSKIELDRELKKELVLEKFGV